VDCKAGYLLVISAYSALIVMKTLSSIGGSCVVIPTVGISITSEHIEPNYDEAGSARGAVICGFLHVVSAVEIFKISAA
jgi:hypothetical protein